MIIVIADDITGAAEIAGVCLRYGLTVAFGIDSLPEEVADVQIIATDSRSATEIDAYATHFKLSSDIFLKHASLVFKKCDSVLRGFVLTELSAMLKVSRLKKVLLQPANPNVGRCILNGTYCIDNKSIENTGFASDPDFPARVSKVEGLLLERSSKHINIGNIHSGRIISIDSDGLFIPDCNSEQELKNCSKLANEQMLLCGSAAFFEQLLIQKGHSIQTTKIETKPISEKFLLVLGSIHPENKKFAQHMEELGCPVVSFPEIMLREKVKKEVLNDWAAGLVQICKNSKKLTLSISDKQVAFSESSIILKQRMDYIIQKIIENCEINELLIGGGATAYSVLKQLNLKILLPINELAPGVVRMKVLQHSNLFLTIKPGSYLWPKKLF